MIFERNESFKEYIKMYPVSSILILVNILMFILLSLSGGSTNSLTLVEFGAFFKPLVLEGEYYRFISSGFLHIGFQHLFFNLFSLFIFASALEKVVGSFKYTALYFVSIIGGSVFSFYFSHPYTISAGASGAIFGIFGAYLSMLLKNKNSFDEATKNIFYVILAVNLVSTFLVSNISIAGHVGGFVFGFIFALLFIKRSA